MSALPLAFAFSAGMLASVNPCGFAMLPAFVSYYLTGEVDTDSSSATRILRSLTLSLPVTVGFIGVFLVAGAAITLGGRALIQITPWAGLVIGVLLIVLGGWSLLSKRSIPIKIPTHSFDYSSRSPRNMLLFGLAYALASLGCTLPIFLSIVGSALALGSFFPSLLVFLSYGVGMGVVLAAVALGAALFQGTVARHLRRVLPYVHTVSALALIGAGLYLIYYQLFVNPFLWGGIL